ncbi:response regulator [Muricoccus aerilatus]|uniref:response regulator n=1 Tax=Muricoccus aerilatus TaxID=452982 RepID=UPI000AF135FB|nr:response regulator [Roseomonas aerilata]
MDDEALAREITAEGLEGAGFSLLTAESSATALALLDAGEAVDLLVTDLSMHGIDGLALIREAQRRHPGLPAILLTGLAISDGRGRARGQRRCLRIPLAPPQAGEHAPPG